MLEVMFLYSSEFVSRWQKMMKEEENVKWPKRIKTSLKLFWDNVVYNNVYINAVYKVFFSLRNDYQAAY